MLEIHFSLFSSEKECCQILFVLSVKPFVPVLFSLSLQIFSSPFSALPFPQEAACVDCPRGFPGFRLGSVRALTGDLKAGGEWAPFLQGLPWAGFIPSSSPPAWGGKAPPLAAPGYSPLLVAPMCPSCVFAGLPLLSSLQIVLNWVCLKTAGYPPWRHHDRPCITCVRFQRIDSSQNLVPR